MNTQPVDVLAFSPHPDDAEIGCSGFLLLAENEGLTTAIVDLSQGEKSTRGNPQTRNRERALAAEHLGLTHRMGLGLPDTQIGMLPDHEDHVIASIRTLRPRIVLAPYFEDRHPDHEAAAQLIKRAVFFAKVKSIGSEAPHRVESVFHYCIHQPFEPSFVLDISNVWARRQHCLAAYESQFSKSFKTGETTALSDDSFLKALEARHRHYGAMINAEFGEPYFSQSPPAIATTASLLRPLSDTTHYGAFR